MNSVAAKMDQQTKSANPFLTWNKSSRSASDGRHQEADATPSPGIENGTKQNLECHKRDVRDEKL